MALSWVDDEHPTSEQLAAWIDYGLVERGLTQDECEAIDTHLFACAFCMLLVTKTMEAAAQFGQSFTARLRQVGLDQALRDLGLW